MERPIHILVVGQDAALRHEFDAAVEGLSKQRVVVTYTTGFAQAEEYVRSRHPDLVCIELAKNIQDLRLFTNALSTIVPNAVVAGLFWSNKLGEDDSDTTLLIDYVRARVQDFLRRPISSTELRQLFERLLVQQTTLQGEVGTIVSVLSNKGGVGKSTLSVNIAVALATRYPDQVLLIDMSLQLGICALMLDVVPKTTIVDAVREKTRLDETMLRQLAVKHACGLHVLAAPANAMDASEVDEESVYRILNLARRAFRYVIVDTFPMLDSTVMAVLDLTNLGFIVMQGTAPNVVGTARLLPVLKGLGFAEDRQRLILNQNYRNFSGNLKPEDIERRLTRTFDYVFPYQKGLLVAANAGAPFALQAHRFFGFGRELALLVDDIVAQRANDLKGAADADLDDQSAPRRALPPSATEATRA